MDINNAARPVVSRLFRAAIVSATLLLPTVLAACTTIEGTNAMVDPVTFEREVMNPTLVGVGIIEKPAAKEQTNEKRGPLVLPKQTASLPAPTDSKLALLPQDSDRVRVDTTNLTEADLQNLRNARVVDLRSLSGRPLTEAESRQLTARMKAANMQQLAGTTKRPLYLPPEEYFTTIGGSQMVCKAANGELVSISDERCPKEIRDAINRSKAQPSTGGEMANPWENNKGTGMI